MLRPILICLAWFAIALVALFLRMQDLDLRPMHADEATGARILANRLDGSYEFNPRHFHGPTLSMTSLVFSRLRTESSWGNFTATTLRIGPAFAGFLLVLTPLLLVRRVGHGAALAAAAFLGSSPLLLYYQRMYIHESWLALFAVLGAIACYRCMEKPSVARGILAGLLLGLMFATKETFIITAFCWVLALLAARSYLKMALPENGSPSWSDYLKPGLAALFALFFSASFLYSNGFTQPSAILDSVRTYFVYETTEGHDKPLLYYFELLLWPKSALGTYWSEAIIPVLSIFPLLAIYRGRPQAPLIVFLLVATILHFAVYSAIAYKTPWLMLVPWAHACLLAACSIYELSQRKRLTRIVLVILVFSGLFFQIRQSLLATGRYANDSRNPYAYVPTSKDLESLSRWLQAIDEINPLELIAVVGDNYWPLPWYLRDFDHVGYWPEVPNDLSQLQVVLATSGKINDCDPILESSHIRLPRGLRANVHMMLYLRNDLWESWTKQNENE